MKKFENLTSPQREKTSVAIQGIDRSTPDDLVTDGKCEELHNLRYQANAWRPVHPHKEKIALPAMPTYCKVVYKHPATDDKYYIVEALVNDKYYYYNFDSSVDLYNEGLTLIASFDAEQRVSHFGNVLIFKNGEDINYYLFRDNAYGEVSANLPLPTIDISYGDYKAYDTRYVYWKVDKEIFLDINTPILPDTYHPAWGNGDVNYFDRAISAIVSGSQDVTITVAHMLYNVSQDIYPPDTEDGRVWGNICLFAALRMDDGSILQVSPLHLISREMPYNVKRIFKGKLEGKDVTSNASFQTADEFIWAESNPITVSPTQNTNLSLEDYRINPILYFTPSLKISIPSQVLVHPLVASVAIFATRVTNVFDIDLFSTVRDNNLVSEVYNESNIVDQPFYLIKEEIVANIKETSNVWDVEITQPLIDRSIHNLVYSPSILTPLYGDTTVDYNDRLHIGNITSVFGGSPHYNKIFARDDSASSQIASGVELKLPSHTVRILGDYTPSSTTPYLLPPYNKVFSYPDTNIKAFLIHWQGADVASRYEAKTSLSNGFAYIFPKGDNLYQFPDFSYQSTHLVPFDTFSATPYLMEQPNRIQVSAPNNPFSFPFENSYAVGSANNRILAMQSAAIEISDEKIGEHPLYVFTEEGIFALRAGSETLYARVDAINYDKIINPNTLAINGAIVYITEKGVHLLQGMQSTVISTPIHGADGMPPLDFLRTCKIIWPKQYNEIVLFNEDGSISRGVAYVFNLDAGYWSTRSLDGVKLNTDELYLQDTIYDLADEDESLALPCHIATRPIKLGDVEFKRLETIIPRMTSNTTAGFMQLLGAVNPNTEYRPLRIVNAPWNSPLIIRRTPFSAKYFQYVMRIFSNSHDLAFTHIDFEWYRKFRSRMR